MTSAAPPPKKYETPLENVLTMAEGLVQELRVMEHFETDRWSKVYVVTNGVEVQRIGVDHGERTVFKRRKPQG